MKLIYRITVAIVTFTIGLNLAWVINLNSRFDDFGKSQANNCDRFCVIPKLKSLANLNPQGDVRVEFIGFKEVKDGKVVEIKLTNNSPESIYYTGYGFGNYLITDLRINGKILERGGICGTGLSGFHLHSGDSMIVNEYLSIFSPHLEGNNNFQIGYYFGKNSSKTGKIYWTDKFILPENLKQELLSKYSRNLVLSRE